MSIFKFKIQNKKFKTARRPTQEMKKKMHDVFKAHK